MKIKPLLYITDESSFFRQLQVVGWGSRSFSFVWEQDFKWSRLGIRSVGAYVRRYESLEAFDAEQANLIGRQKKWPVFFGVEVELDGDAEAAEARIKEQIAINERLNDRLRFLEVALSAQDQTQPAVANHATENFEPAEPAPQQSEVPASFPTAPIAPAALDVPPPPAAEQPRRGRRG